MQESLLQQVRELVGDLESSFSSETWCQLCHLLDDSGDTDREKVALDYVCHHLQQRYLQERQPLYGWWKARKKMQGHRFEPMVTNWESFLWDAGRSVGEQRPLWGNEETAMVWCPPGTFLMGSPREELGRDKDELLHKVSMERGFWVGETPVVQGHFREVMKTNVWDLPSTPSFLRKGYHAPVEGVTWSMAAAYCNRLSELEGVPEAHWFYKVEGRGLRVKASVRKAWRGKDFLACRGYRLPTEAEWEYACRAGTNTARYTGDLMTSNVPYAPGLEEIAWFRSSGSGGKWTEMAAPPGMGGTRLVKTKQPNEWGIHDTLGNIWEWCLDWYGRYDDRDEVVCDPRGPNDGEHRVIRGGCWCDPARMIRAAARGRREPLWRSKDVGFRIVRACD